MMSDIKLVLFIISLSLYLVELLLFFVIKRLFKKKQTSEDQLLTQLSAIIAHVSFDHMAIFSLLYFLMLLLARIIPILFSLIITYQLISITFDFVLIKKMRR